MWTMGISVSRIPLELSWWEVTTAGLGGVMRQVEALKENRHSRKSRGRDANPWEAHITGALGELVVSKWLGRYWLMCVASPWELFADVGAYQVRYTDHIGGHLLIYEDDEPERTFILVTGGVRTPTALRFYVCGFMRAQEARRLDWRHEATADWEASWWVPQEALTAPEFLPDVLVRRAA